VFNDGFTADLSVDWNMLPTAFLWMNVTGICANGRGKSAPRSLRSGLQRST
jgi:hypothetical protein